MKKKLSKSLFFALLVGSISAVDPKDMGASSQSNLSSQEQERIGLNNGGSQGEPIVARTEMEEDFVTETEKESEDKKEDCKMLVHKVFLSTRNIFSVTPGDRIGSKCRVSTEYFVKKNCTSDFDALNLKDKFSNKRYKNLKIIIDTLLENMDDALRSAKRAGRFDLNVIKAAVQAFIPGETSITAFPVNPITKNVIKDTLNKLMRSNNKVYKEFSIFFNKKNQEKIHNFMKDYQYIDRREVLKQIKNELRRAIYKLIDEHTIEKKYIHLETIQSSPLLDKREFFKEHSKTEREASDSLEKSKYDAGGDKLHPMGPEATKIQEEEALSLDEKKRAIEAKQKEKNLWDNLQGSGAQIINSPFLHGNITDRHPLEREMGEDIPPSVDPKPSIIPIRIISSSGKGNGHEQNLNPEMVQRQDTSPLEEIKEDGKKGSMNFRSPKNSKDEDSSGIYKEIPNSEHKKSHEVSPEVDASHFSISSRGDKDSDVLSNYEIFYGNERITRAKKRQIKEFAKPHYVSPVNLILNQGNKEEPEDFIGNKRNRRKGNRRKDDIKMLLPQEEPSKSLAPSVPREEADIFKTKTSLSGEEDGKKEEDLKPKEKRRSAFTPYLSSLLVKSEGLTGDTENGLAVVKNTLGIENDMYPRQGKVFHPKIIEKVD